VVGVMGTVAVPSGVVVACAGVVLVSVEVAVTARGVVWVLPRSVIDDTRRPVVPVGVAVVDVVGVEGVGPQ